MNTFKRKALTSVVLASLGAAGAAHAVYQDPNGQGQALIYPYYTVQTVNGNAFNTYISVVNSTTQAKVLKVRAREGKTSQEVLDFNLYLSPNDMWVAYVAPAASGGGAMLFAPDASCTDPAIPSGGVLFRNFQYVGDVLEDDSLDRAREGYIEIIEMAVILNTAAAAATHNSAGTPTCSGLRASTVSGTPANMGPANRTTPTGGLSGTGTLINVNNGVEMGYNATALSNLTSTPGGIYFPVGTEQGTLADADPTAVVVSNNRVYRSVFTTDAVTGGAKAVSAVLMHSALINEYVLDNTTRSQTDWVMTFPTKHFFYNPFPDGTPVTPFTAVLDEDGACEPMTLTVYNREEAGESANDFSPLPIGRREGLCWESSVLSIRNGSPHMPTGTTSGVLGSLNTIPVNILSTFQNGWGRAVFSGTNATAVGLTSSAASRTTNILTAGFVDGPQTYFGLPVVGFAVRTFNNSTLQVGGTTVLSNYGSAFDHKYEQTIIPAP